MSYKKILFLAKGLRFSDVIVGTVTAFLGISILVTLGAVVNFSPLNSNLNVLIVLLILDVTLAFLLGIILSRGFIRKWIAKKYGLSGSRLHLKMVVSFGLVAIIPALLVVSFLGLFLNFGMETWFGDRVRAAVNASSVVAQSYLKEHQKNIKGIALAMANDLNRVAPQFDQNPQLFANVVSSLSTFRNLSEAVVVDSSGRTLARSQLSFSLGFNFSSDDLLRGVLGSRAGEVFVIRNGNENTVRAGVKLESFFDAYLLVGKFVDAQVLQHISETTGAANQYAKLQKNKDNLQTKFLFVFSLFAFFLVLIAIWLGWSIASTISTPIGLLIDAADKVREGDLTARVDFDDKNSADEVNKLSKSFNRMTEQIYTQQQGLIGANRQLDERRRFTEVVLSGVSAGVIGLDKNGKIYLTNRSASDLLSTDLEQHAGKLLGSCIPEMMQLVSQVMADTDRNKQGEIKIERDGLEKTLVVSIAVEKIKGKIMGYVVTFDDVSELLFAQRRAAWADVAQRVAHEIKNPLTPIQLSAERLKRKYKDEIKSDPATFLMCIDTIVRQVDGIGRMVDEFSSFARMPQTKFEELNFTDLCKQNMFLERNRFPNIKYEMNNEIVPVMLSCDRQQISRSLINIMKNAAESISEGMDLVEGYTGKIELTLSDHKNKISLVITDNGGGFPKNIIDRITEPYVTTRPHGTGLGLAIAAKIMEDNNGELILRNKRKGGAEVTLIFNKFV
jgi:two-component system nitrogen regulation sensor histidine kinase NtrY